MCPSNFHIWVTPIEENKMGKPTKLKLNKDAVFLSDPGWFTSKKLPNDTLNGSPDIKIGDGYVV